MANKLELLYAKIMFRMDTKKRMAACRKLGSLLNNNFTLMDALSRMERIESHGGTKPGEPFAIVFREWQKNLERGMSFSDATRGWVPMHETLLLTLGDVSKLSIALGNIGRVVEGVEKIKSSLFSAVAYPLFLLALTFGIVIMVGLYLVPPLSDAAGGEVAWRGTAASLVWLATFSKNYWYFFTGGFIGLVLVIWLSMQTWSGWLRTMFDKLPPWNMYKVQVGVGWLMSLSAMVAAGGTIPVAMRMLADNSTKYLRDILEMAMRHVANGDNLGVALQNTGRNFPNEEIIGDLAIYADMNGFDENLFKIADDYLNESVRRMDSLSSTMNSVGILIVSVIIAWVVFGTFQMQDQITAALT